MKSILFICFLFFTLYSNAQEKALSVEKIYATGVIHTKGIQMMKWMEDGKSYSRIEFNKEDNANEIVRYDVATNHRTVIVPSGWLKDEATGKSLRLQDYIWSKDNRQMLLYHNAQRVWRYPTRGDYQVLDMETGKRTVLGKGLAGKSLMFAKFSPDGNYVAYVSRNNIYVEDISSQKITQLTFDGSDAIINGTFDWMYEEEFSCRDGFRWSPDGKSIAYWQSDTRGTGVFYMIDNVDSIYSQMIPLPYPKVGTTLSAVKVGIVPVSGGATEWMDIPGDPRENYLPRMDYVPESNDLMVHQFNRAQNINTVWMLRNGKPEVLFTETDDAWVDVNDEIRWLDKNRSFTWMSERDGWCHLYKISRDGKDIQCLTPGAFDVIQVTGMDQEKGYVYFMATEENYTQRYLYRASLKGKGKVEKIPVDGQSGQHSYNFSPTGKWAVHTFQNASTPPEYGMVQFPQNKTIRILEDNAEAKRKFDDLSLAKKEFIKVDIGEIILDAWMIKPLGFDPAKKYPVIVHVYGEPAGSTVQDSWSGGDLWHRYLAQEGYIVVSIDNRGANVPRGRAWRKSIYRKIGILNAADQAAAMEKMIQQYDFIDPERIGISGWSGGGSTTLTCMFQYPEIYKTGIAIAFIAHQKLYDAAYQERYMGLPTGDDDAFEQGSTVKYAGNLKGNLLLVHGTGDDNVHYQNCELMINELVRHKKMFSLLSYPMRGHGIYEGENTTMHLRLSIDKYWKENLPPGGR
ncbi:MAG: S9 family peptidase [Bacteroidales bacterium]|nr:S9 family peptidase [Bacteroidales bacterium]